MIQGIMRSPNQREVKRLTRRIKNQALKVLLKPGKENIRVFTEGFFALSMMFFLI